METIDIEVRIDRKMDVTVHIADVITIETISDAVCPAGEIQTINSHFLCS